MAKDYSKEASRIIKKALKEALSPVELRKLTDDALQVMLAEAGKSAAATGKGLGVGGPRQRTGGTDICTCPVCGAKAPHPRGVPCSAITCPKCGSPMTGVALPPMPTEEKESE